MSGVTQVFVHFSRLPYNRRKVVRSESDMPDLCTKLNKRMVKDWSKYFNYLVLILSFQSQFEAMLRHAFSGLQSEKNQTFCAFWAKPSKVTCKSLYNYSKLRILYFCKQRQEAKLKLMPSLFIESKFSILN